MKRTIIDLPKLTALVDEFLAETNGFCSETSVCIGVIGGKQINLVVTTEGEETKAHKRYRCVERKERPS